MMHDTLLDCLVVATEQLNNPKSRSFLAVHTGHWLRISLAMHTRLHTEIGHPYGELGWDYFALQQNFAVAGIISTLIVAEIRNNLAKKTEAQGDGIIDADNVVLVTSFAEFKNRIQHTKGIVIIGKPDGEYAILSEKKLKCQTVANITEDEYSKIPLGYAAFIINEIQNVKIDLPWKTLQYLTWTFERGEEPTEVEGKGHYSVVSGWKAYARWMQAYLLNNPTAIHPWINNIPYLLKDRRTTAIAHWQELSQILSYERSREIAELFVQQLNEYSICINSLINAYEKNASHNELRQLILKCYIIDQQTLPIFKKTKKLYHDLKHQKLL